MVAIGLVITAAVGIAIAVIGVLYLIRPRAAATGFGLPVVPEGPALAWLRLKGVRDLASGVATGVLLLVAPPPVIGWMLLAFSLIPIGDAATVLTARGSAARALGIHGATAALMVAGGALLVLAP